MGVGRRRHLVVVQELVKVANDDGQLVPTATEYCRRKAELVTQGGSEVLKHDQVQARRKMLLRLPWDTQTKAIVPEMQVLFEGRTLNIEAVVNVNGMNREVELVCGESP